MRWEDSDRGLPNSWLPVWNAREKVKQSIQKFGRVESNLFRISFGGPGSCFVFSWQPKDYIPVDVSQRFASFSNDSWYRKKRETAKGWMYRRSIPGSRVDDFPTMFEECDSELMKITSFVGGIESDQRG